MARIARSSVSLAGTKRSSSREAAIASPPDWIEPQLFTLVERAPSGDGWVHEVKFDGCSMAARIDRGEVRLLTRSGLDWTKKYPETAEALAKLPVTSAYIDGELCWVGADGVTSFALMQSASDTGTGALGYFAFDLMALDGALIACLPLLQRKAKLAEVFKKPPPRAAYSDHNDNPGEAVREAACKLGLEGVVSKQIDSQYSPGNRGIWVKSKCLNRAEFVIVGWTDPEGSRSSIGALLLGYHEHGRLMYAGRVGAGFPEKTLRMVHGKLKPLAIDKMPLAVAPPRKSRFGGTLSLSKVHWVQPRLVAEVTYLTWTDDGLLRHTVFVGLVRTSLPRTCDVRRRAGGHRTREAMGTLTRWRSSRSNVSRLALATQSAARGTNALRFHSASVQEKPSYARAKTSQGPSRYSRAQTGSHWRVRRRHIDRTRTHLRRVLHVRSPGTQCTRRAFHD
jgi:DNA ligase D-like protein (predicted ligase)